MEKLYSITKKVLIESVENIDVTCDQFIGSKIKEFRVKNNLSQNDLENLVSVSRTSISNIESGKQRLTIKNLEEFCLIFNCKSSDILPF